jgi:hypothetical protein
MSLILSGTNGLSDVDGSAATPAIRGTDTNTGIFFPAADTIAFAEGGVEAMRLDASGNMGLGVTPSAWASSFKALQSSGGSSFASQSDRLIVGQNWYNNGSSDLYINTAAASIYRQTAGSHAWFTAASGTAGNAISFTQAMTLDNVALGSAYSSLSLNNTTGGGVVFQQSGTAKMSIFNAANDGYIDRNNAAGKLFFRNTANGTTDATIDASGNFLLGVTSGTNKLVVQASSGTTPIAQFANASSSGNAACIATSIESNGNNTSSYHLRSTTQNVNIWQLFGNGTSSWSSDERLKKNIETTRNGYIDDLCRLRVVKYNWHNQDDGAPKELGLIAQEVEQVFPGLVQEVDDGTVLNGIENTKVLKGSVLPFMLLKAIQEQQALIAQLQADVAALKA